MSFDVLSIFQKGNNGNCLRCIKYFMSDVDKSIYNMKRLSGLTGFVKLSADQCNVSFFENFVSIEVDSLDHKNKIICSLRY
jgi:hypothetical protein